MFVQFRYSVYSSVEKHILPLLLLHGVAFLNGVK